jgi:hypothetical protein
MTSSFRIDDQSPTGMPLDLFGKLIVIFLILPVFFDEDMLLDIV